jgi:hypothetical protein
MQIQGARLRIAVSTAAICTWLFLSPALTLAQTQDPIVGTWNIHGANTDGSNPFISVMTFNVGGTTVEYDSAGTNSSASPGKSIALGKWNKQVNGTYTFKSQNYIYDDVGKLSQIAIAGCKFNLFPKLKNFNGPCSISFYQCSVKQCPGTLQAGPGAYKISGKRF